MVHAEQVYLIHIPLVIFLIFLALGEKTLHGIETRLALKIISNVQYSAAYFASTLRRSQSTLLQMPLLPSQVHNPPNEAGVDIEAGIMDLFRSRKIEYPHVPKCNEWGRNPELARWNERAATARSFFLIGMDFDSHS